MPHSLELYRGTLSEFSRLLLAAFQKRVLPYTPTSYHSTQQDVLLLQSTTIQFKEKKRINNIAVLGMTATRRLTLQPEYQALDERAHTSDVR